jgi:probable rRNA maturation factor
LKINIYNRQKALLISPSSAKKVVRALFDFLSVSCDEISFYFVTEKTIVDLHDKHFNDPTPTDCITFPIDDSYLGDIFICPAIAIQYASSKDLDPLEETLLYMIHGVLHLLKFNDLEPKERSCMRKKEKSCMRHLKKIKLTLTSP